MKRKYLLTTMKYITIFLVIIALVVLIYDILERLFTAESSKVKYEQQIESYRDSLEQLRQVISSDGNPYRFETVYNEGFADGVEWMENEYIKIQSRP